ADHVMYSELGEVYLDEHAHSTAQRATVVAALTTKAGPIDAACEAIHGISAACDVAVSSLRARRATRPGRSDLGELLFVGDQHRVLDERRVHFANSISRKANCRARYHARDLARERRLFYRREI